MTSDIKKDLLREIDDKAKRKSDLKEEIARRDSHIEEFVMKMVDEIDDMIVNAINPSLTAQLSVFYVKALHERLKVIDKDVEIQVQWQTVSDNIPRIGGILISWSKAYQEDNNCDAQLFVDVVSSLLR